jgi:thioredoxin-like negative regulator of GroEL
MASFQGYSEKIQIRYQLAIQATRVQRNKQAEKHLLSLASIKPSKLDSRDIQLIDYWYLIASENGLTVRSAL